jgi:hypothetical protein
MEAKELKIGNYLLKATNDDYFEVNLKDLKIINTGESKSRPIPLTEEWLLKFGFSKRESFSYSEWYMGINPVTRDWMFDITWIEGYDYPFYRNGHFSIKYIHQLQNLYFALTGTELTIK